VKNLNGHPSRSGDLSTKDSSVFATKTDPVFNFALIFLQTTKYQRKIIQNIENLAQKGASRYAVPSNLHSTHELATDHFE
jgi:hypothetical protein